MNQDVKVQFDAVAQEYDRQRRQLIPCFDEFYGAAVALAEVGEETSSEGTAAEARRGPAILDLGAGTGLLSAFLLQKFPNARLTLIDLSASMIEQARLRFAGHEAAERIIYLVADYTNYVFAEPFDLVVSALSIHHLEDEAKAKLFANVHAMLKEGGCFVNADQASGTSASYDVLYKRKWEAAIRGSGLSEAAIASAIGRRRLDRNAGVADQLRWLREAGFAEADCVYKYNEFAVFHARK